MNTVGDLRSVQHHEVPASQLFGFEQEGPDEYDQIIKESLKELEQNQLEEQMFQEMLKDTLVQSK